MWPSTIALEVQFSLWPWPLLSSHTPDEIYFDALEIQVIAYVSVLGKKSEGKNEPQADLGINTHE